MPASGRLHVTAGGQPLTLLRPTLFGNTNSIEHREGSLGWKSYKVCKNGPGSRKNGTTVTRPAFHTWRMASGRSSCSVFSGNRNLPLVKFPHSALQRAFCSSDTRHYSRRTMLFASCQVYCPALEEEPTSPLKYLSLFTTPLSVEINFPLFGNNGHRRDAS